MMKGSIECTGKVLIAVGGFRMLVKHKYIKSFPRHDLQ